MLANSALLLNGDLGPVLDCKAGSLDGSLLTEVDILVGTDDLDQEQQRLGLGVVVLLELRGDGLDPLCVGCSSRPNVSKHVDSVFEKVALWKSNSRIWLSWSSVTSL